MRAAWRPAVTRGALLLMESLWVYALVAFFVAAIAEGGKPTLLGAGAVVFASFAVSRFLQQTALSLGLIRAWGVALSLLLFYAIVRIDFFGDWRLWDFSWADALFNHTEATARERVDAVFGAPLLWAFWMRGALRGQQHIGFEEVVASFAIGVLVVVFVELLQGGPNDTPGVVAQVAVPYVAIGLFAIALSHAARSDDEFGRSFAPTWLVAVGGAVLVLATVALAFVLIDFSTVADLLGAAARGIGWLVATVFFYILWPFVWLTERLMDAIRWLIQEVYRGQRQERPPMQPDQAPAPEGEEEASKALPGWLQLLIRVLAGGSLVTLLLLGTALLFSRFRRRDRPGEVKESTYQEGRLAADLGGLIGSLLGRLRPAFHFGGERLDPARRLYFDLLHAAAQRGIERHAAETPLELAPRLDATFAAETPSRITALFDDVRYGGIAPPDEEVQRLRQEWEARRQ